MVTVATDTVAAGSWNLNAMQPSRCQNRTGPGRACSWFSLRTAGPESSSGKEYRTAEIEPLEGSNQSAERESTVGTNCRIVARRCRKSVAAVPLALVWQATAAAAAVRAWWELWPLANVGVATGRRSGLTAVEVDDDAMEDVVAQFPELLRAAARARTGEGKEQFYFAYHRGRQLRSGRLVAGAVAYADGGYVVAPPSRLCDCWYCLLARRTARRERP